MLDKSVKVFEGSVRLVEEDCNPWKVPIARWEVGNEVQRLNRRGEQSVEKSRPDRCVAHCCERFEVEEK